MKFPLITFVVLAFCSISANNPQQQVVSGKPVYYYPAANIYFDTGNALYTIFDEQEGWKQAENINEEIKPSLGSKAIILTPATPVWKDNPADRMYYSTALFANPAQVIAKYKADEVTFAAKKSVAAPPKNSEAEKTKTGIGRFFKKIFGKKES